MPARETGRMAKFVLVISTCPADAAESIALALLEQHLCACVNIIPKVLSIYHWEGEIERGNESVLLMKTEGSKKEELLGALRRVHPYEVPEFVVVPIQWGSRPYLEWISASVGQETSH